MGPALAPLGHARATTRPAPRRSAARRSPPAGRRAAHRSTGAPGAGPAGERLPPPRAGAPTRRRSHRSSAGGRPAPGPPGRGARRTPASPDRPLEVEVGDEVRRARRVVEGEPVQVTVRPSHRALQHGVHPVQGQVRGDLDAPPHRWLRATQGDLESQEERALQRRGQLDLAVAEGLEGDGWSGIVEQVPGQLGPLLRRPVGQPGAKRLGIVRYGGQVAHATDPTTSVEEAGADVPRPTGHAQTPRTRVSLLS